MDEIRRVRPWLWGGLTVAVAVGAFHAGARYVERRLALRIETFATRIGAQVHFDRLRVGVFPPVQLTGLVIEKPGQGRVRIEKLSASPRLGPSGIGLIGRVWIDGTSLILPAGLEVQVKPSVWDLDPERSLTLRSPVAGLTLTRVEGPGGPGFEGRATQLQVDRLFGFALDGVSNGELGILDGEARFEGDPRLNLKARWRFRAIGAETDGRISVTATPGGPSFETEARIQSLEFTRLFEAVGLGAPTSGDLGSVSGTVGASGLLADPATVEVSQQILFTRPKVRPAAVERLRDDFVHEVTPRQGADRRIEVSSLSPDFIALPDVPALFIRALLIAEDAAFFSHPGIDLSEMPRAIATNWARGEPVRGASTITQQLAKNLFLTREKNLHRKLKELSYSFLLESTLGKVRILEIYLNIIEWGPGLHGLRPAASHYFGKEPQALTPRETAFLVALIPGPVKYQRSIEGGELRPGFETLVNNLLVKLRSVDALSEEEYQAARAEKLAFRGPPPEIDALDEDQDDR